MVCFSTFRLTFNKDQYSQYKKHILERIYRLATKDDIMNHGGNIGINGDVKVISEDDERMKIEFTIYNMIPLITIFPDVQLADENYSDEYDVIEYIKNEIRDVIYMVRLDVMMHKKRTYKLRLPLMPIIKELVKLKIIRSYITLDDTTFLVVPNNPATVIMISNDDVLNIDNIEQGQIPTFNVETGFSGIRSTILDDSFKCWKDKADITAPIFSIITH